MRKHMILNAGCIKTHCQDNISLQKPVIWLFMQINPLMVIPVSTRSKLRAYEEDTLSHEASLFYKYMSLPVGMRRLGTNE